jgi:hypothetical protein
VKHLSPVHHAVLSVAGPPCVLFLFLQAKLEEKERKHFLKTKGISFEGAQQQQQHDTACTLQSSMTAWQRQVYEVVEQRQLLQPAGHWALLLCL